jgi:hypothetical protein
MSQIPEHLEDVGPGWHPILTRLHGQLSAVAPGYRVEQVKEKFGGLRVYLDYGDPTERTAAEAACIELAEDLIELHEEEFYRTCEYCGQPGWPRDGGWVKTLCDVCKAAGEAARLTQAWGD